jgi:hypothetical protein
MAFDSHASLSRSQYTALYLVLSSTPTCPRRQFLIVTQLHIWFFFPLPLSTIHHLLSYKAGLLSGPDTVEATFDIAIQVNINQKKDKASSVFERS